MSTVSTTPAMPSLLHSGTVMPLVGLVLLSVAIGCWRDAGTPRRFWRGCFWALFSVGFWGGDALLALCGPTVTHRIMGGVVLSLGALAGLGWSTRAAVADTPEALAARRSHAQSLGHRVFLPVIAIPVLTVLGVLIGPWLKGAEVALIDPKQLTLGALTLACLGALLVAWRITGASPRVAVREARHVVESIGWPLLLPLMLAMLGGVFLASHTGEAIEALARALVDPSNKGLLVCVFTFGMAGFTMVMGNAFAAFPVMAAGVALPFLIRGHGADPAPLLSIGMLCGYCGTLLTPMAANFNIVPAALLQLQDRHGVIKAQAPTALLLLLVQTALLYVLI